RRQYWNNRPLRAGDFTVRLRPVAEAVERRLLLSGRAGDLSAGPVTAPFTVEAQVVDSDGSVILAGHKFSSSGGNQSVVERLGTDGLPVDSFGKGNNGMVIGAPGQNSEWFNVMLQGEKILVV